MTKFLTPLTEPVGFFWLLVMIVFFWRLCRREWKRAVLPGLLALVMYLVGGTKLSAHLLAGLEREYARSTPTDVQRVDAVVMLGGVLAVSSNDPLAFNLLQAGDRALVAVDLVRRWKPRALVLGGGVHGRPGNEQTEGGLLKGWLDRWRLVSVPVFALEGCKNTRDEAERTLALVQQYRWTKLALVTSASHMKRSEAVFRALGMDVVCVACDFQGLAAFEERPRIAVAPGPAGFEVLGVYLHEKVGWWLYRWRGWVKS